MARLRCISQYSAGILGLIFVVLGISLKWILFPSMLETMVIANLDLREGTQMYDMFKDPPVQIYMTYMLFHVENPEEVKIGGKPKLTECGPYSYREVQRKEDVSEFKAQTLSYGKYVEYHFDSDESEALGCKNKDGEAKCDPIADEITILNPLLIGIVELLKPLKEAPLFRSLIVNIFNENRDDLFITVPIQSLLYTGFPSKTADTINKLIPSLLEMFNIPLKEEDISHLLNFLIPAQIKGGTFAFFKGKNATKLENQYVIENGRFDISQLLNVVEFNGQKSLPKTWWPDVAETPSSQYSGGGGVCHRIGGTDGTMFPPFLRKEVPLWLFVGELCRSVWMEFDSEVKVKGLNAYRYRVGKEVFNIHNPVNYCFCQDFHQCAKADLENDKWDATGCKDKCLVGAMDVSGCYGAPVIMSPPHFLNSDPSLLEAVEGLEPDVEKHDTVMDVQPILGVTLRAHKRLQISVRVSKSDEIEELKSVTDGLVFPMFWADEGAEIDDDSVSELNSQLFTPMIVVDVLGIGLGLVVGPLLLLLCFYLVYTNK